MACLCLCPVSLCPVPSPRLGSAYRVCCTRRRLSHSHGHRSTSESISRYLPTVPCLHLHYRPRHA